MINKKVSLASLSSLHDNSLVINLSDVEERMRRMIREDTLRNESQRFLSQYYTTSRPFIWVGYGGLSPKADSLVDYLSVLDSIGLSKEAFRVKQISDDINRFRNLEFEGKNNTITKVLARLEYNLSRALLNYCKGQRYGFVSPNKLLNHFEVKDSDSLHVSYHHLSDISNTHPTDSFFLAVISSVKGNKFVSTLQSMSPSSALYKRLQKELLSTGRGSYRNEIILNMEKCRWFRMEKIEEEAKHILVNIPSQMLYAYDKKRDSLVTMRIGCGSLATKTPLLGSKIYRMDINPVWIIPQSIVDKEISRHAGNVKYFEARRYYVCKRSSFQRVNLSSVTASMLQSGKYAVVQEGGKDNALGRIIFRFYNNFSVYLHDTASPSVFSRSDRRVSHGCIRVQKPYLLASFLLGDDNEELLEKIDYSMKVDLSKQLVDSVWVEPEIDKSMLVKSVNVAPKVPVVIAYFTIYPNSADELVSYPDIYGYDKAIIKSLRAYL